MLLSQTFSFFVCCWWSHKINESPLRRRCYRKCENLLFNWCSFFFFRFQFFSRLIFNAFGLSLCRKKRKSSSYSFTITLTAYITITNTMRTCSMNRWNEKCFPNLNWLLTELSECCWVYTLQSCAYVLVRAYSL